ncbi:hypothetical protein [Nisaea sp.]|uniref:hypothetical protein n=1 Tax=Nisaea sp. TaxID=2024842 RepID=UPI0032ED9705
MKIAITVRMLALILGLATSMVAALPSAPLAQSSPDILLTVSGDIDSGAAVHFDRAALEEFAIGTVRTSTPWTEGVQEFQAIPLKSLLDHVGAKGSQLRAVALNDYAADVPIEDTVAAGGFIAVRQNGKAISIRDKGPLWILFPYDTDPKLTTDTYLNRSVWQLRSLVVR